MGEEDERCAARGTTDWHRGTSASARMVGPGHSGVGNRLPAARSPRVAEKGLDRSASVETPVIDMREAASASSLGVAKAAAERQALEARRRFTKYSFIGIHLVPLNIRRPLGDVASLVLHALATEEAAMGFPVEQGFRFVVSTGSARREYGRLDFPIYVCGPGIGVRSLLGLMEKHRIPRMYLSQDIYKYVERQWDLGGGDYGIACPATARERKFEKVGFVDYMRIAEDFRSDLAQSIANVVVHEFVHMTGVHVHDSSGLMLPRNAAQYGVSIPLAEVSRQRMFQQLVQLRAHAVVP